MIGFIVPTSDAAAWAIIVPGLAVLAWWRFGRDAVATLVRVWRADRDASLKARVEVARRLEHPSTLPAVTLDEVPDGHEGFNDLAAEVLGDWDQWQQEVDA